MIPCLNSWTTRYRAIAREYISDEFWQRIRYLQSIMLRGTRALYNRAHEMRYTHASPDVPGASFRDGKTPVVCYLLRSQRDWKLRTPAEVTRSKHPLLHLPLGVVIPFLSLTVARPTWCFSTPPWLTPPFIPSKSPFPEPDLYPLLIASPPVPTSHWRRQRWWSSDRETLVNLSQASRHHAHQGACSAFGSRPIFGGSCKW